MNQQNQGSQYMLVANTFGLQVETAEIIEVTKATQPEYLPKPCYIVGQGSNILFLAAHINLAVVRCAEQTFQIAETEHDHLVTLGGGLDWHQTVDKLIERQIYGVENLALIPGTVGAAPVQNIGAYGVEFAEFCHAVSGFNLNTGEYQTLNKDQCDFGYRDSIFKRQLKAQFLILEVQLKLSKQWQARLDYGPLKNLAKTSSARQVFDAVCQIRREKLPSPAQLGNAGSFFKNPIVDKSLADKLKQDWPDLVCYPISEHKVKLAAGYLIDRAGLKGFSLGQAAVHQQQALVLVNLGGATSNDIIALAKHVVTTVKQTFFVELEPEVRLFGNTGEMQFKELA